MSKIKVGNPQNLNKLISAIRKEKAEKFNMSHVFTKNNRAVSPERNPIVFKRLTKNFLQPECGAAACLTGWCLALFPTNMPANLFLAYMPIKDSLNVNSEVATSMFYGYWYNRKTKADYYGRMGDITKTEALQMLTAVKNGTATLKNARIYY